MTPLPSVMQLPNSPKCLCYAYKTGSTAAEVMCDLFLSLLHNLNQYIINYIPLYQLSKKICISLVTHPLTQALKLSFLQKVNKSAAELTFTLLVLFNHQFL